MHEAIGSISTTCSSLAMMTSWRETPPLSPFGYVPVPLPHAAVGGSRRSRCGAHHPAPTRGAPELGKPQPISGTQFVLGCPTRRGLACSSNLLSPRRVTTHRRTPRDHQRSQSLCVPSAVRKKVKIALLSLAYCRIKQPARAPLLKYQVWTTGENK